MKKKQAMAIFLAIVITILALGAYYWVDRLKDECTSRDREINNCVPAGKCGPTPSIDAVIDCDVKNYDKKYNPDI